MTLPRKTDRNGNTSHSELVSHRRRHPRAFPGTNIRNLRNQIGDSCCSEMWATRLHAIGSLCANDCSSLSQPFLCGPAERQTANHSHGRSSEDDYAVFNVMAFGATGNGSTDDTSAIRSAISSLTAVGGGILYFPHGTYYSSTCEFSISVPTLVMGIGQLAIESTQLGSLIQCGSPSANLFNVTTDLFTIRDIAFTNTTTSTSGAAIFMDGAHIESRINAEDFAINGFYDAIDINVAAYWDISSFHITNPVRYGISVQNVLHNDERDWQIHDGSCVAGPQTNNSNAPGSSACIAIFTSGGGKFHTPQKQCAAGTRQF